MVSRNNLLFGLSLLIALTTSKLEACSPNCHTCKRGYICTVCTSGFYGTSCDTKCSPNCKAGECYDWSGQCKQGCKEGWYGGQCNKKCKAKCKGGKCLDITGHCEECEDHRYGHYCEHTCKCHNDKCDRKTGFCVTSSELVCDSCKPGCPHLCDSGPDEKNRAEINMFVVSFLTILFIGFIVAASCAVKKKRQALRARTRSGNGSKRRKLLLNDQSGDQCPVSPDRPPLPSTSRSHSSHLVRSSSRNSKRRKGSTHLVRTASKTSTNHKGSVHFGKSVTEPTTSNTRHISFTQPLVLISEPALIDTEEHVGTSNSTDLTAYSGAYDNVTPNIFQDGVEDNSITTSPALPVQPAASIPRPPPPTYHELFPPS